MAFLIIAFYGAGFYFSCVPKMKKKLKKETVLSLLFLGAGLVIALLSAEGIHWGNPVHLINRLFDYIVG